MPPTNVDPPYHARFRAVLNPVFAPGRIRSLTEGTRATTAGLIERIAPLGRCEFQRDFARVMPVHVFLRMLDLPTDRGDEFVSWATSYVHAGDQDEREWATAKVMDFLRGLLDERERNPGDDMFSRIVAFRKNPRFQREEEVMGMAMNSFIGGLDTVTNMLTFTAWHLATHPEARQRLIAEPEIVGRAAEEYLRRFGLAVTARIINADVGRKGLDMKRGDYLLVVDPLAGIDERVWDDPMEIDFDRDTRGHDTFGNGVHRCVGEHLARMELIVFLEEWLKRIPDFELDPDVPPVTRGGAVIGMPQLGLRWVV
jgi:cytochrome P450